jgi:AcrR family transcriptional regulator
MPTEDSSKGRRGDATRGRILAAARERFAADGYERATIRAIAADAASDPALVIRYFGNKEALFAAAADFDLHLPKLETLSRGSIGEVLVAHLLERWEGDDTLVALLRASVTNDVAAERVRAIFATQVKTEIASLGDDPKVAVVRAAMISSQMLGFALCRYVLRLPPVVALRRAEIVKWLGPTIQRYACGKISL